MLTTDRIVRIDVGAHRTGDPVARTIKVLNDSGGSVDIVGIKSGCECQGVRFVARDGTTLDPTPDNPVAIASGETLRMQIEQQTPISGPFSLPFQIVGKNSPDLPSFVIEGVSCKRLYSTMNEAYRDSIVFDGMAPGESRSFRFELRSLEDVAFQPTIASKTSWHLDCEVEPLDEANTRWAVTGHLDAGLLERTVGGHILVKSRAGDTLVLRVLGRVESTLSIEKLPMVDLGVLPIGRFSRSFRLGSGEGIEGIEQLRATIVDNRSSDAWRVNVSIDRDEVGIVLGIAGTVLRPGDLDARLGLRAGNDGGTDRLTVRAIARR